jgi:hypothetical protein
VSGGNQDWRTPPEFVEAVCRRFGGIDFDLAAQAGHSVTGDIETSFTPEQDSLTQDWGAIYVPSHDRPKCPVRFLNPPFRDLRPWAAKCETFRRFPFWTLLLVPASMGSLWWRDHVLGKCVADGVTRMTFVGADAVYPKDLALLCYGYGVSGSGFWDWRLDVPGG